MAQMTPGLYSRLLDFLEHFYELVILDLGTGITDPLAQFAADRADQTVVITTPEWVAAAACSERFATSSSSAARSCSTRPRPGATRAIAR
jgi:septum formation inhibitor-activating ATPase MinD